MLTATALVTASFAIATIGGLFAIGLTGPSTDQAAPAVAASASPTPQSLESTPVATAEAAEPVAVAWTEMTAADYFEGDRSSSEDLETWEGHGFHVVVQQGSVRNRASSGMPVAFEPLRIKVTRPDGSAVESSFDKPLSAKARLSPAGILLETWYATDRATIKRLATGERAVNRCCRLEPDGAVSFKRGYDSPAGGPIRPNAYRGKLDRIGLTMGDVRAIAAGDGRKRTNKYQGFWFSPDGESWTPVPSLNELPRNLGTAGNDAGFFAATQRKLLYSPDGSDWRVVRELPKETFDNEHRHYGLPTWRDKVIASDSRTWFDATGASGRFEPGLGGGLALSDMSLFVYDSERNSVGSSPDGETWTVSPLPDAMARSCSGGPECLLSPVHINEHGFHALNLDSGQLLTTVDGVTWSTTSLPEPLHELTWSDAWLTGSDTDLLIVTRDDLVYRLPGSGANAPSDPET